ncbi:ferric reductase-like transmembrane domain-containing protein [Microbacterium sp. SLBN-146]|uniref:ferredoxin reductase family protein n=1 Tax=Microbacterium sp. SLBN-146 TaxID=2768457 RepID=UPI00114D71AB|nr:ferredoxin reductase family protein [Microbacterium sp. SLBN-146]TQJ30962.1 putative ferric reductase [Microbacterium sp. SLBN-146]
MVTLVPPARVRPTAVRRRSRLAPGLWRFGAILALWATSLFVVFLWVAGGGVDALAGGPAEALDSAGRLTGLVASNLLLYQVLLMARVPLFERGFGRDAITRMHRLVGFWSFTLLLAHIALLVAGYAVAAGLDPLTQLWEFVWDYPGMLLATAGTGLLVLVTVTSIRRARRKLRYESWHLLHLYAYLGVGLAVPHQLWTGADFLSSPAATAYWWMLWVTAAASVIVFRIAVPLWRSIRHDLRVAEVRPDGTSGVSVRMRGRDVSRLGARPGQFLVWRFLDGPGWSRGHPLSLAAAPRNDELMISARIVGDGTSRLSTLASGTRVLIEGPYGGMTGDRRTGAKLLMIGAGAGVAPLVALLESEAYAPGEATLIVRDSSPDEALRRDAVADLVRTRGVVHVGLPGHRASTGAPWLPATHAAWSGPDVFRHVAPDLEDYDAFVCGPAAWMDAVCGDLRTAGLPASRIHTESFSI